MRRTTIGRFLTGLVVLLALAPGVAAAQADAACFVAKANEARAARGYPALQVDPMLTSIATAHAQEMANEGKAVPLDNDSLIKQAPPGAVLLGQNAGFGGDCEAINANFLAYPADQNRILDARYDRVGVGVASVGATFYVHEILMQGISAPAPRPAVSPTAAAPSAPRPAAPPSARPSPSARPAVPFVPVPSSITTETPVTASPSESPSPLATGVRPARPRPLLVGFGLAVIAAAALGGLMQSRRARR